MLAVNELAPAQTPPNHAPVQVKGVVEAVMVTLGVVQVKVCVPGTVTKGAVVLVNTLSVAELVQPPASITETV